MGYKGRFDFVNVYEDRLDRLQLEIAKAVHRKKWNEVAKLRVEEKRLKDYLKELKAN